MYNVMYCMFFVFYIVSRKISCISNMTLYRYMYVRIVKILILFTYYNNIDIQCYYNYDCVSYFYD